MRSNLKLLCAIAVLGVGIIFFRYPPVSSQDWASWIQAVGSIAAIAFAWLGIKHQIDTAERQRRRENAQINGEMIALCRVVANEVVDAFNQTSLLLSKAAQENSFAVISLDRFEALAQTVSLLLQREISPKLFGPFVIFQREIAKTLTAARLYNQEGSTPTYVQVRNAEWRENAILRAMEQMTALSDPPTSAYAKGALWRRPSSAK